MTGCESAVLSDCVSGLESAMFGFPQKARFPFGVKYARGLSSLNREMKERVLKALRHQREKGGGLRACRGPKPGQGEQRAGLDCEQSTPG